MVQSLHELDHHVCALISSGFGSDPVMSEFAAHGLAGVLTKPYTVRRLGETLGRVLRKARSVPLGALDGHGRPEQEPRPGG